MVGTEPTAPDRGALPAELTSFVGRRREVALTRRLLSRSRLLTLTGVGGVGKTRLALRMAAEVRRTFPDGVWFVELAALHDPQLVPHSMASALELRQVSAEPTADLAQYLERKQLLVVLDNCEHLSQAVAVMVSKLLAAAPGLRVLATSRHVLGVEGEQILAVPPLSTPSEETRVEAGDATHYESVALFLERATAVAPDFAIVDGNRAAVTELCRRLDGIPLAIELAAVWLRILSPAQMVDRLEDRFRLLTTVRPAAPARQQALDAAIAWSFELCSSAEQLLWSRLSVFAGGFDLEAAEEVCSGDGIARDEVLGLLANLVNKSIMTRQQTSDHTAAWYQMLETIRQYGAARLPGPESVHELRTRHRDHYRSMAGRYAAEGFGPEQANWIIRLRREHGNVGQRWSSASRSRGRPPPRWTSLRRSGTSGSRATSGRAIATSSRRSRSPPSRPGAGRTACGRPAIWPCSPPSSTRPRRCWTSAARSPSASTTTCCGPGSRNAGATRRCTAATCPQRSTCSRRPGPASVQSGTRLASSTR